MTTTDVAIAARFVVALVLIASGTGKLVGVGRSVDSFRREFGGYAWVSVGVAAALPLGELALAALLLAVDSSWPGYVALGAFVVFTGVLLRKFLKDDRTPCNCFGAASRKRALSVGSLLRNTWFMVLAIVATGAATLHEPSALLATVLVGCGLAGVSAVLVVRT